MINSLVCTIDYIFVWGLGLVFNTLLLVEHIPKVAKSTVDLESP